MRLYVVRHGIAVDRADPGCPPDPERYLTDEGVVRTAAAARGLATLLEERPVIWTSPYRRARQSAELVAEALGIDDEDIEDSDALLPEKDPAELFRRLSDVKGDALLVVGHAPNLDWLLGYALTGRIADCVHLKKAGAAFLELPKKKRDGASLQWLFTPKALRRLAPA